MIFESFIVSYVFMLQKYCFFWRCAKKCVILQFEKFIYRLKGIIHTQMKDLESLRANIDELDQLLWDIISRRVEVAREIGEWKHTHGEAIIQPERYQEVLNHCLEQGKQHGLSEELVREVMDALHKESVRVES